MIMKRILFLVLAAVMVFALAACGNKPSVPQNTNEPEAAATQNPTESMPANRQTSEPDTTSGTDPATDAPSAETKILVVYFSRTGEQYSVGVIDKGNTAIVAEMIAEKTGADLYEILPETDYYPYTYSALTDVAKKEQSENARPAIKGELFPNRKNIALLTRAGWKDTKQGWEFCNFIESIRGMNVQIYTPDSYTDDELLEKLAENKKDTFVIVHDWPSRNESLYTYIQGLVDVSRRLDQLGIPVFVTRDYLLVEGVMGGVVTYTRTIGKNAANWLKEYFKNGADDSYVALTYYRNVLDWNALQRYHVKESKGISSTTSEYPTFEVPCSRHYSRHYQRPPDENRQDC